ncbi:Galactose oxidase/kelch repeat superfamily protein isoform 1 [Hibiscus syriacus]|uniref:1-phosphatidylinositol-4-phosphate 5-kinase n=1 Tax=Hibiscus syriacus TaxID=106335 RepID=A0A6A3CJ89_HIBSY|nr:Galactose oxidase/kelch repeat superfamily protein isoform 1 [Hibiscus syriacus]
MVRREIDGRFKKDISASDLTDSQRYWVHYSRQQCLSLPPGSITAFEWKDYCPRAFRLIQELENINHECYMISICSDETLRKVTSSLKPGNFFILSTDNRFVVKTLRKSEVRVLLEMLQAYYNHIRKFRSTVLSKLYGVHVVKPDGGAKVYFSVVSNIFKSDLLMHRCYDLKGSLRGRKVEKVRFREKVLHKESDLDFHFCLEPLVRHRLLEQIKHDCAFLEAAGVMDYSMLLGFHVKGSPKDLLEAGRSLSTDSERGGSVDTSPSDRRRVSCDSLYQSDLSSQRYSAASIRELSFSDQWLPGNSRTTRFGEELSARGVHVPNNRIGTLTLHENLKSGECYDVLLYFGIVDFFQNFSVIKRLERAYKSLQFDRRMITAVNPKAYSSRFQDFIGDIFKADELLNLPADLANGKMQRKDAADAMKGVGFEACEGLQKSWKDVTMYINLLGVWMREYEIPMGMESTFPVWLGRESHFR